MNLPILFNETVQYVYFYNVLPDDVDELVNLIRRLTGYKYHTFYREIGDSYMTFVVEFSVKHAFGYNIHLAHGSYRSVATTKKCHV